MVPLDLVFVLLLLALVSGLYIARAVLILTGVYKDPILHLFQKYGDDDPIFYPFPGLLFAMSLFVLFSAVVLALYGLGDWRIFLPGLLFMFGAALAREYSWMAERYPQILQALPRWYARLREYTTRMERRRIAYMWLHLPWRARLIYNGSDHAFFLWADLVIIGTDL